MEENIHEKLTSYLELLDEIKDKTEDEGTAAVVLQEISKDRRMEEMRQDREAKNSVPATEKQKRFMKKLGVDYPKTITKKEASVLIDEDLGKSEE